MKLIKKWKEQHLHENHENRGYGAAIGGMWSYSFTPTGLGNILRVKCNACGKKLDVTDYGSW